MAENRKSRPSWTQVKELEAKLADQIEGTSRLVKDCDIWREKYQKLFEVYKKLKKERYLKEFKIVTGEAQELVDAENKFVNDVIADLRGKVTTLESSNNFMDAEMKKLRAELEQEHATVDHLAAEVGRLKSRGFWARVFNKD